MKIQRNLCWKEGGGEIAKKREDLKCVMGVDGDGGGLKRHSHMEYIQSRKYSRKGTFSL